MILDIVRELLGDLVTRLVGDRLDPDAREVGRGEAGEPKWLLSFSWIYRVLCSITTILLAVALVVFARAWWIGALRFVAVFPVLAVLVLVMGLFTRDAWTLEIEVSAWGIAERRGGTTVTAFPWSQLKRAELVSILESYRLVPRHGRSIRFHRYIDGLRAFRVCLARYAPQGAIESVRSELGPASRPPARRRRAPP